MKPREMALVALFAALTGVGAWIGLPLPYVPITLQTLFVMLAGVILGAKLGALSQAVYVVVGLVGAPVFAGGMGGPTMIFRPTFGYLVGFVLGAYLTGWLVQRGGEIKFWRVFISCLIGLAVVYAFGVPYLWFCLNFIVGKSFDFGKALRFGLLIFLPGAVIKAIIATILGMEVRKRTTL